MKSPRRRSRRSETNGPNRRRDGSGPTRRHPGKQLTLAKHHDAGRRQAKSASELAIDQLHTATAEGDLLLLAPLLEPRPVLAGADQQQALTTSPGGFDLARKAGQLTVKQIRQPGAKIHAAPRPVAHPIDQPDRRLAQDAVDHLAGLLQMFRRHGQHSTRHLTLEVHIELVQMVLPLRLQDDG